MEMVIASFASPIVGILAQRVFGYKPPTEGASEVETDRENAKSLAKALFAAIGIPMALCCFIYSFLYCTYPRDRERARIEALLAPDMQRLIDDDSPGSSTDQMYSQLPHGSNSKAKSDNEAIEKDVESVRWEDSGEVSFLSHPPKSNS